MGAFGGFTLTNKGRNLQAKAQAGAVLNYTRAAIGDGTLTGQSIVALTALISPKKTLPITKLRMIPPDRAAVGTIISNQSITTGFYFREIGIFAQDPDEGEILYAYANSGANAEYLPPAGGPDVIEKSIDMLVVVGRASQVTATIDSSLVFPTFAEMEDAIEEALASVKVPLVDSNTSTSKTEAPTADALRRTVESTAEALALKQNVLRLADNYLAASVLVNAAPDGSGRSYPDGVSMFKVSSSAGGWPTANGYVLTFRAGSGGYQIFYEMYVGVVQTDKTARQWTRSKRDSNTFWQDWAQSLTEVDLAAHNADYVRQPGYTPVVRNSSDVYTGTLSPAPLTPNSLPDGFAVTIVPDAANTTTTPKLQLNNGSIIQIRRNPTTDFAVGAIKAGVPLALIKVGSYFLARSVGATGTATAAQVRAGATFSNESNVDLVGTQPVRATAAQTVTPGTTDQVKAAGIYDGAITIKGDANLLPSNILAGKTIFGVSGAVAVGKKYMAVAVSGVDGQFVDLGFTPSIIKFIANNYLYFASFQTRDGNGNIVGIGSSAAGGGATTPVYTYVPTSGSNAMGLTSSGYIRNQGYGPGYMYAWE